MLINIKTKELLRDLRSRLLSLYDNQLDIVNKVSNLIILTSLGIKETDLIVKDEIMINQIQLDNLNSNIYKHINKYMPLQYIEGFIEFLDLKIFIEPPVLIPRQETEYWVYNLIKRLDALKNEDIKILDLCTGSGCIALAFAKYFKNSTVYAVDISQNTCALAIKNAQENSIKNIKVIRSDLYTNLDNLNEDTKFDLIVANPPYISYEQFKDLEPMVKDWEDPIALMANDNGLEIIKKIIYNSVNFLNERCDFKLNNWPQLVLEIDYTQSNIVKNILLDNKFAAIEIIKDLAGNDRVIQAILQR